MARRGRPRRPAVDPAFVRRLAVAIGDRSVNSIARTIGTTEGVIRGWRAGARPGAGLLAAFADEVGVPLGWLVSGAKPRVRVKAVGFPRPRIRVKALCSPAGGG